MKLWILLPSCFLLAVQGAVIPQEKLSSQEVFFLRRQAEFWKDRDYGLMKEQIAEFLASNASSNIHNNLYAMLGDILYQENNYAEALVQYRLITDLEWKEKTASRRWQCLYLAGAYDEIIQEISAESELSLEEKFILADSIFRKMQAAPSLELAAQAKPLLLDLLNTSYKEKALLPLAEIHRELKESQEAVPLYLMLAEKDSHQCEDFLLQAAALQLEFDPVLALSTFKQVVDLGGEKASDAAYHELLLLFQNEQFSDLIDRAPVLEALLHGDKKKLFDFCLARSYFKVDLLSEAGKQLSAFIEQENENTAYKRSAFLMLMQCAKETENAALFDQALSQFQSAFPGDEEVGKSLLLHAQIALQNGNLLQASQDLNQLLSDFPDFEGQETLLYEQAVLLYKTEEWKASRQAFMAYLEKFPSTPQISSIWPSIVQCSIQELKKKAIGKEQLISDLKQAIALEDNDSYQFLLGQLLFEARRFEEAVSTLGRFCKNHPDHAEASLLQALSLKENGSDLYELISSSERALALSEDATHKAALRLYLFNAYLSLKDYDKAASHLYDTVTFDGSSVQQENLIWLAHYYKETSQEKGTELFKKILQVDETYAVHFDPTQTHLEAEALQLAELLSVSQRAQLLASLVDLQKSHENLPWERQGLVLLELSKSLVELKQPEEALKKLDELISQGAPTSILSAALLEKSRILGAMGETDNPNLPFILSTLKDLQIQKDLTNEPVHLEAALDYADLRARLASPENRIDSTLFFLNRIKDDFNALDTAISQEYHEARLRFPEKDHLFQSYMQCLEAEILCWEIKEALQNGDEEKAEHNREVATHLLEVILLDKESTNYLKLRAQEKLKDL